MGFLLKGDRTGNFRVNAQDEGKRLDVYMAEQLGISRNRAQILIREGHIKVNGDECKKHHLISHRELVTWEIPLPPSEEIIPEDLPLKIYHDDEDILIVSKPAPMVVYPGPGHPHGTLANALISTHPEITGVGGRGRPGIVHRLDRDTSGLMVIAKNHGSYNTLVRLMKERLVKREYLALVDGVIDEESGTVDAPMGRSLRHRKRMAVLPFGGRRAVTHYRVLERFSDYTLIEVTLETGRTHQIRVHMTYTGHPVAGDNEYGRHRGGIPPGLDRHFLHAYRLSFSHPSSGKTVEFKDPMPDELEMVLKNLRDEKKRESH